MRENIKYLPFILALHSAWFWLGVWILFYLQITDYAGIGILESSMFFIGFLIEIPTGAISDMFGKKRTLVLAFFFYGLGNLLMGFASTYVHLFLSVFAMVIGGALYSGTAEALVYDSLKSLNQEKLYDKVQSKVEKLGLITLAISGFAGGFIYSIQPGLVFTATGIVGFFGSLLVLLFVKEPPIDTVKFSLQNYFKQNLEGFKQIFKMSKPKLLFLFSLMIVLGVANMMDHVLDYAFAIDIGYEEKSLGILFGILPLLAAFAAHIFPKLRDRLSKTSILLITSILFFATLLLAPIKTFAFGTVLIAARILTGPILNVLALDTVNQNVDSKYRATSISTFAMIKQLPYILLAYFLGSLVDSNGASIVIFMLGITFASLFLLFNILFKIK